MSGSARNVQIAQILVCKLFGLCAILANERAMVKALTRNDAGALGRASPAILDSSSQSIGSGELPIAVAGQATGLLARGGAQGTVESTMSGGVCQACARRVLTSFSVCQVGRPMATRFFYCYKSPCPQTITSALLCAL